jgi:hypothetical protein
VENCALRMGREPVPVGRLGAELGVTRQAAADSVLRAVITGDGALQSAASAIRGPG